MRPQIGFNFSICSIFHYWIASSRSGLNLSRNPSTVRPAFKSPRTSPWTVKITEVGVSGDARKRKLTLSKTKAM